MKQFLTLLKKDFTIEAKTKEVLVLQFSMSVLFGTLCAVGIQESFLKADELKAIAPTFIWVIFLFSATLAVGRSFEYELKNDAIYGLILSGASPSLVFLSKFITNSIIVFVGQALAIIVLTLLTNLTILPYFLSLMIVNGLVAVGFCAIATLLMPMTMSAKLKGMLLPLILLPLLFPILFSGLTLTASILESGTVATESIWFTMILGFDAIYVMLGVNLFDKVILE